MSPKTSPSWRPRHQVSEEDESFRRSTSWKSTQNDNNPMRSSDQMMKSNIISNSTTTTSIQQLGQPTNKLKRKALDSEYDNGDKGDLDLDLSLKIAPKDIGGGGQVDHITADTTLTALSLSTSNFPSSNVVISSKSSKEENGVIKRGKVLASTLDLTL